MATKKNDNGKGWFGDRDRHRKAGSEGGATTYEEYGAEFYSKIGRKGGEARKQNLGYAGYSEMGRKGGEAVSRDRAHMAEIGRRGGLSRGKRAKNQLLKA